MKMSKSASSPASSSAAAAAAKKSRSRTGCKSCKKSKIKCDELRPTCGNCQRCGKKCDYSLKLTWGGRPYKVPRVEKMNPIASLSRSQLDVAAAAPKVKKPQSQPTQAAAAESKFHFQQPINIVNIRHDDPSGNLNVSLTRKHASPKPSLNPSENLNFLLKMSDPSLSISNLLHKEKDSSMIRPPPQKKTQEYTGKLSKAPPNHTENTQFFQSLEESYTDPVVKKEPSPLSRDASPFASETVSSNIQNLNNMLGSMFNDKLTQFSPWSFLEEIDKTVNTTDIPDFQSLGTPKISEVESIASSNSQLLSNPAINLINNDTSAVSDLINKYNLEEFADDLTKIQGLQEPSQDNLFSIPMMNESRRPATNHHTQPTSNMQIAATNCPSPTSTSSSLSEIMEPIPRGLLPLPDMLLNAPYFYDSFLFFTNLTSSILTPADSSVYVNNPFKKVLPKLAMTNNGLMSLIVAFGSAHKSVLLKKDSTEIVDSLLGRALSDLLVLLNNKETCTSDLTLTLVMFFTSFLAFNYKSDKWKIHMNGAKQIFLMRGYNKPFDKILLDYKTDGSLISGEIKKSKLLYFLIRWFAYIDLFTNLSSPLEPTEDEIVKYCSSSPSHMDSLSPISDSFSSPNSFSSTFSLIDPNNAASSTNEPADVKDDPHSSSNDPDNQIDYEVAETEEDLMKEESHQDIDYMLGFKIKFLPIFSQLCKLIKRVNLIKRSNERMNLNSTMSSVGLSPSIIESAINVQTKFQKLKFTVYDTSNTSRAKSLNAVIASNHCFLLMGLIQLYRRVLLMPRGSKVIQEMCLGILDAMTKYIDTKQPNSLGLILPLFIAGCECQNVNIQPLFIEKLHDCQEKGSVSAESGIEIMEKCWETGKDWNEIMIEYNKHVVFL